MLFAPRIVIIIIQHETNEMHICQINNLIFLSVLHVSKPGGGGGFFFREGGCKSGWGRGGF